MTFDLSIWGRMEWGHGNECDISYTRCSDNDADIRSADEIVRIILWKRPIEIF